MLNQMTSWISRLGYYKIGNPATGNNIEIREDGTFRLANDSSCWRDMVMDLSGRKLESNAGTVDYDFDEVAIQFSSGGDISEANDRVTGNQEINHEFKVGDGIVFRPHIHWWQQVTTLAVLPIIFTLEYRHQKNGLAKTADWVEITAEAGAGGGDVYDHTAKANGTYNQITRFDDIDIDCSISDTLQFRMTRTDEETGGIFAYFFDVHGIVDSFGSDSEIVKAT